MKNYNFILIFLMGFFSGISVIIFNKNKGIKQQQLETTELVVGSEFINSNINTNLHEDEIVNTLDNVAENLVESIRERDKVHAEVIGKYYKLAVLEQKKYGFPASVKLAQMLVEGGYSQTFPKGSKLVQEANNPFGIKYFGDGVPTRIQKWNELVYPGEWVSVLDDCNHQKCRFVKFRGMWHAFRYHSEFMVGTNGTPSHYASYVTTGDWKDWISAIEKGKYATSKKYNQQLTTIIENYKLYMLDDFATVV